MNNRWATALHEAGHAAAGLALGVAVFRVSLNAQDGGLCWHDFTSSSKDAYLVAAGPIAQKLLADFPPPQEREQSSEPKSFAELPPHIAEKVRRYYAENDGTFGKDAVSDERQLALYAIEDCEDEPERWAYRIRIANQVATTIVNAHREQIIRIATLLFHQQVIFQDEIAAAFKGDEQAPTPN